jgi:hypothetical protein
MEYMMLEEYLVTGQGYEKTDTYKQTLILHDTFQASDEHDARNQFNAKFAFTHNVLNIYSAISLND